MADITTGLVAHWKMDEGTGTECADETGTNTGTHRYTPTFVAGKFEGGVSFASASTEDVSIGSAAATSNQTISLWVKRSATDAGRVILFGKTLISINSGTEITYWPDTSVAGITYSTLPNISDGLWHNLAIVQSGTGITYYQDAIEEDSSTGATAISTDAQASYIASFGGSNHITATLDDVRIYSRALSSGDVRGLLNPYLDAAISPGVSARVSKLISYPLDSTQD